LAFLVSRNQEADSSTQGFYTCRGFAVLIRLTSGYHFRRRVPSPIRDILGKNEIWHSLKTSSRSHAKPFACEIYAITERLFRSVSHISDELKDNEDFLRNELSDDVRELFDLLIQTYQQEITNLQKKYEHQKIRHSVEMLELGQTAEKATNGANKALNLLEKTAKQLKTAKSATSSAIISLQSQIDEVKALLKPKETKPSPIFSDAIQTFLDTKTKVKSTVIHSYQATFKRFLEVCGDKPLREYTGVDAGLFKSMMEQFPETYGKQRNDNRTIQQFVALAKKQNLPRVSGKSVKNHFTKLSGLFKYFFYVI